jgi:hypothetical protein
VPDTDAQFTGYVDCLKGIAEDNWNEFESALHLAADGWERFVRVDCPGQPPCVCFMAGLGMMNLAKCYGLNNAALSVDHIPTL